MPRLSEARLGDDGSGERFEIQRVGAVCAGGHEADGLGRVMLAHAELACLLALRGAAAYDLHPARLDGVVEGVGCGSAFCVSMCAFVLVKQVN